MRGTLGVIERKTLGALLILSDNQMEVDVPNIRIANTMGYAKTGGAITFALRALEMNNYIVKDGRKIKVLL